VSGQPYTDFPHSDAIWREYHSITGHSPGHSTTEARDSQYHINGDTIILGVQYSKIDYSGWRTTTNSSVGGTTEESVFECYYVGAIRSDTLKHVYVFSAYDTSESLLYDFNLAVGDTLPLTFNYSTYYYNVNIVHSVDSIFMDSEFRRRFNICTTVNSNVVISLIEGVGSTKGLFGSLVLPPISEYVNELICFYLNNELWYSSNSSPCKIYSCSDEGTSEIAVYPNPVGSEIGLSFYGISGTYDLIIINASGQIVHSENIDVSAHPIHSIYKKLARGIYIVRLNNKAKRYTTKFIVQ
jgi:hypothetical protein